MKVAFIAMGYNAESDWEIELNIQRAKQVAVDWWKAGFVVICPHANSAHFGGIVDESVFYDGYKELVKRSDVVVAGPGWEKSTGAMGEVRVAIENGIEVVYL